jgi:RNA polymerase sigma-70 factor (ECF subfamily)
MQGRTVEEKRDVYALLERIKKDDREAFRELVSLYQKRIFLLAFSFFRNREDAMDIVQETFMRLYQKIHTFREGENFQSWIFQVAKNLCIDHYRKNHSKRKEWASDQNIEEMSLSSQNSDHSHQALDLRMIFSRCLEKLAEKQRVVFVLKHYNQLKYREIAQVLNISPGTVKSLHFKAVRNLRGLISPYLGRVQ